MLTSPPFKYSFLSCYLSLLLKTHLLDQIMYLARANSFAKWEDSCQELGQGIEVIRLSKQTMDLVLKKEYQSFNEHVEGSYKVSLIEVKTPGLYSCLPVPEEDLQEGRTGIFHKGV